MTGLTERGVTLLEVLVALVVLSLVALGYFQLFHGSHALVASSREWSDAIAYAEDAMERTKLGNTQPASLEALPGGFRRQVTSRPWRPGLIRLTVSVLLPGGGRFDLERLTRVQTPGPAAGPVAGPVGDPW